MTTFLGFKQVSATYFATLSKSDKVGYLWLVRDNVREVEGVEQYDADIYFGSRMYAHITPNTVNLDTIIEEIKEDVSGNTADIENIYASIEELRELIEKNQAVLTQDLEVIGVTVGNLNNGKTFASGTTIENVLRTMLMKTIDVYSGAPSTTLVMNGANQYTTYEIGTVLNITLGTTYKDGYFSGNTGYSYSTTAGCENTGVTYYSGSTSANNVCTSAVTVTVAQQTYTFGATNSYKASTVTPKNNMGEDSSVKIAAGTTGKSTKQFYGEYKYYYGEITNEEYATLYDGDYDAKIKTLTSAFTSNLKIGDFNNTAGHTMLIAIPTTYKIASITQLGLPVDLSNSYETKSLKIGGTSSINYDIYYVSNVSTDATNEFKNITISKQ